MNLIVFPFHDYRKSLTEGFRTRDGHFIQHLGKNPFIDKLIIVNRPFPIIGTIAKRGSIHIAGEVIYAYKNFKLIKIDPKVYVIDFISLDVINVVHLGKRWFWKTYAEASFIDFIQESLKILKINDFNILSHTLQNVDLIPKLSANKVVFDAFDNWLRIPSNFKYQDIIQSSYARYDNLAKMWITNSLENRNYYLSNFSHSRIEVVTNGVDPERFRPGKRIPDDLKKISKPVVGFGGKITHLIDTDLVNYLVLTYPKINFVFIGQILDKSIYKRITKRNNFIYLGDKHYDDYPAYVEYFDVCIIPYHYGEKAHGGDAIKFYEYLAANKVIISTHGNGIQQINKNVLIADNKEIFSKYLAQSLDQVVEKFTLPEHFTWAYKTNQIIESFND